MDDHDINIFWKKIVNTINDGLMFIGPDGTLLMMNKSFETLTGYSSEEAIGMPCTMLGCDACEHVIHETGPSAWCQLFEKNHADLKKCRCLIKKKDGSFLPVLKNASVLFDEDKQILGVVETLTDISELVKLDEKVHILSRQRELDNDFFGILGNSREMNQVIEMVRKTSESNAPVVILGESGTGKELVANAIHLCGPRKNGPFIQLNCAALNEAVLESELFGHVKGAFTGAHTSRIGRFEAANHGDFFLDEIGDMPMSIQTKLLRVLESGQFERVGDITPVAVDARIITATNRDLEALIEEKAFRQDLFFRINVLPIHLPPLRDRKEDIPLLVDAFIHRLNARTKKSVTGPDPSAMEAFMDYPWPGNIRELKNVIEYAFVIAEGPTIQHGHLPRKILESGDARSPSPGPLAPPLVHSRDANEKKELIRALKQTEGNQTRAAKLLNINRVTVWNRMKKYGIDLKKVLSA